MQTKALLLILTIASLFALLTVGAYVTVANYGDACGNTVGQDYPLCQGMILPPLQVGPIMEYTHRVLASLSALFLFVTTFLYLRSKEAPVAVRRSLLVASLLIVLEIVLGALVVVTKEPYWLVTLHQSNALLVFGLTVGAGFLALNEG